MARRNVLTVLALLTVLLTVVPLNPGRAGGPEPPLPPEPSKAHPLGLQIPESLRLRHEAFQAEFTQATKESGKVGDAARAIEKLATAHFPKAKDAFAPLSLLPRLADGTVTAEERVESIKMAEKLRTGLPKSHGEHRELVAGLKKLAEAAKEEGKTDYVRFAERLTLHIQEEEEVLYPAVLLIGEYVKGSVGKK